MAPAAVASSVPEGHGETILVVEDNSVLRRILCRQLTGANYRVLEADSGKSALEMIQHGEAFDLLLTDIVMPGGMNGHELARLASVLRPELKIVLTSGFSDVRNGGASMSTTLRFLRKPYSREDLSRVLFDALNGETR
jgi:CheY-like chemotaxis protein